MTDAYQNPGPTREEIDATPGMLLLEFGTPWCGHCQSGAAAVQKALTEFPGVRLVKVEDGPGRKLGRSYRVKLWPTLIAIKDGVEVARVVRPTTTEQIGPLLAQLL